MTPFAKLKEKPHEHSNEYAQSSNHIVADYCNPLICRRTGATHFIAGAPLDHVNNLGWTALIESIVLGDGGQRHTDTLRELVNAGANVNLADRNGQTPLMLARWRGYTEMVSILQSIPE